MSRTGKDLLKIYSSVCIVITTCCCFFSTYFFFLLFFLSLLLFMITWLQQHRVRSLSDPAFFPIATAWFSWHDFTLSLVNLTLCRCLDNMCLASTFSIYLLFQKATLVQAYSLPLAFFLSQHFSFFLFSEQTISIW